VGQTGAFLGTPPTGKQVEYSGFTVYRIESGKIQEIWIDHNATIELMGKLGIELDPMGQRKRQIHWILLSQFVKMRATSFSGKN
jgi:hypothetical protein